MAGHVRIGDVLWVATNKWCALAARRQVWGDLRFGAWGVYPVTGAPVSRV
jgi:hypothetical protein